MMLLGTLSAGEATMPCLIGIERNRVIVVAQDDLSRFSWPVDSAMMDASMRSLTLFEDGNEMYRFTPDLPDRFRWVMTAALQEATSRRDPWWRFRKAPTVRELARKLNIDQAAA